jgi:hypothetical protein
MCEEYNPPSWDPSHLWPFGAARKPATDADENRRGSASRCMACWNVTQTGTPASKTRGAMKYDQCPGSVNPGLQTPTLDRHRFSAKTDTPLPNGIRAAATWNLIERH